MSSCQGELAGKNFTVSAVDPDGNILVADTVTTLRNGFFELWLPRNRKVVLKIQGLNRTAIGTIGTFDDSQTCVTTFQLR